MLGGQASRQCCTLIRRLRTYEDGLIASEVDVSRGKIVEALVIASMVVVLDEGRDVAFEIAG